MNSDTEELDKIMNPSFYSDHYLCYDRIYPYTTEMISSYMKDIDNKKVLSVCGSGDHYLNSIYLGAKSVDSFDCNSFALKYLSLKKAACQVLSKEEFYEFLTNDASKYFPKIWDYLSYEDFIFWKHYIHKYASHTGIQGTSLFYPRSGIYPRRNYYMNTSGYLQLQHNLKNHSNNSLFLGNINDLTFSNQYDVIYLSNICHYQKRDDFSKTIERLYQDNLLENGILYYGYYYSDDENIPYYCHEFPNTSILEFPGTFSNSTNRVLFLQKK